jgi:osmoprotectant transport system substrate-binding protein
VKAAVAGVLGLFVAVFTTPGANAADMIVVASKIDTEGALLGNIIAILLKQDGLSVDSRLQLGPTQIVRRAILEGQIDIYPEYTGNGAVFFSSENDPVWHDPARGYDTVKTLDAERNHLIWLAAAPADNSWAIAIRGDLAKTQALATLRDFAAFVNRGGRVKLAASAEFVESPGALPAFEQAYGFTLARDQLLELVGGDTSATIRAAAEGISSVNAAMAYGTDGALAALGLVTLADDKNAQTVYRPAPVIRAAVLAAHPEIASLLDPAFAGLSQEKLQALNAKIAVEGADAGAVATDYLASVGLAK